MFAGSIAGVLLGCGKPAADSATTTTATATPAAASTNDSSALRNVVLILADTLRADHLGTYGYARRTSPKLDVWASKSVVFEQARSQAGCTFPSVNSLFTARYPADFLGQANGAIGIPDEMSTLAEVLAAAGLRTLAVSASQIVRQSASHFNPLGGFDDGFAVFDESCAGEDATCVRRVAQRLLANTPEPFFLYLHFMDPHQPYQPPAKSRMYSTQPTGLPFIDEGTTKPLSDWLYRGKPKPEFGPEHVQHLIDLYDDEIRHLDRELARLFTYLEQNGRADDTLVILASDHGEEFLEHGFVSHCQSVYDAAIHVPLIVHLPGAPAGRRIAEDVENLAVAPTILDYLGIAAPAAFVGRSLRPLIEFGTSPSPVDSFSGQRTQRALTDWPHKVIYDLDRRQGMAFDLASDPGEAHDLAANEPIRTRELLARLRDRVRATEGEDSKRSISRANEAEKRLQSVGYIQ